MSRIAAECRPWAECLYIRTLLSVSVVSVVFMVDTVRKKIYGKQFSPRSGICQGMSDYLEITWKSGNNGNGSLRNYGCSAQGERIYFQERKPYIEVLTLFLIENYI